MSEYLVTWSYSLDVDFVIEAEDEEEAKELVEDMQIAEVSDLGIGSPGGGLHFELTEIDDDTDVRELRHAARRQFNLLVVKGRD